MKYRKKRKQPKGAPAWMVTFSDMVQLILVFFIMLFAMSQVDARKFQAISDSFRNRAIFDFLPSTVSLDNPGDTSVNHSKGENDNEFEYPVEMVSKKKTSKEQQNETDTLDELMEEIDTYLREHELTNIISATRTERGVVLVLPESVLFHSGEAYIISSAKPFLNDVARLLVDLPNSIRVEGHADSRPISNYRYPSNWELSGARSSSVIRFLIDEYEINPNRLSGGIYAETRPIAPNTTDENLSLNRRVEIIILEQSNEED